MMEPLKCFVVGAACLLVFSACVAAALAAIIMPMWYAVGLYVLFMCVVAGFIGYDIRNDN